MLITAFAPVDSPQYVTPVQPQDLAEGATLTYTADGYTHSTRVLCVIDDVAYLVAWRRRRLPLR
jgi:hypothetical protein